MHPLELQIKDLKETIEKKDKRLKELQEAFRSIGDQLDEIKEMLHPSRQNRVDKLRSKLSSLDS